MKVHMCEDVEKSMPSMKWRQWGVYMVVGNLVEHFGLWDTPGRENGQFSLR